MGERGGICALVADNPLGPFDLTQAYLLTNPSLYAGRLALDRMGNPVLMAFHNYDKSGLFVGRISASIRSNPTTDIALIFHQCQEFWTHNLPLPQRLDGHEKNATGRCEFAMQEPTHLGQVPEYGIPSGDSRIPVPLEMVPRDDSYLG